MKTRNTKLGVIAITLLSAAMPFTAKAQDKVKASVGADIVSGYIWRGQDLGGVSLQPNASIAYKGLSLEAWGSVGIEKTDADGYDAKEFDLTLGYSTGGFSVSITDYWYNTGAGYFHYGAPQYNPPVRSPSGLRLRTGSSKLVHQLCRRRRCQGEW